MRVAFLGVAITHPVLVFLECGNRINDESLLNAGLRLPDIVRTMPYKVLNNEYAGSTVNDGTVTMQQFVTGLLLTLLLIAATLIVFRCLILYLYRRRINKDALPAGDPDHNELMAVINALSREMGLARVPDVVLVRGHWETPCAVGCISHTIYLSTALVHDLEPEELKVVLAHELAHIKRRDNLRHSIILALRDFQFFNPISYISIRRMNLEREKACDRLALTVTKMSPLQLAACLVRMSRRAFSVRMHQRPVLQYGNMGLSVGNGSLLEKRIKYLLTMDKSCYDTEKSLRWQIPRFLALSALWLLLVVPMFYLSIKIGDYTLMIR